MPYHPERSWIEQLAVRFGMIPRSPADSLPAGTQIEHTKTLPRLRRAPTPNQWHNHVELDAKAWPKSAQKRHYRLLPTTCFNCEAACGLLAFVDKETGEIRKFEGNPAHPASRGRNCAKGPATINQVNDPDRILTPMKRVGKRGEGKWQAVSWDEAIADISSRIRKALLENRKDEIVYHVGRPGAEGSIDRILRAWGVDGHNSHTNICSSGARLGYALWSGYDRPMPDYANARFILALNAHLESGHFFNPMAQRISEGLARGAKMAVVDPRLSNTASHAQYWMPCRPGTEAALVLSLAHVILKERLVDRAYVERWVNWRAFLDAHADQEGILDFGFWILDWKTRAAGCRVGSAHQGGGAEQRGELQNCGGARGAGVVGQAHPTTHHSPPGPDPSIQNPKSKIQNRTVDDFLDALEVLYADFTPEYAERECGIPAATVVEVARLIGAAGSRFCSHVWRGAASAHQGGWQVSRCLMLLHALTGSYGTEGGCLPSAWSKYKASLINVPPPQNHWNELHWPREYPLTHYEMSELLPHFLKDGRGRIEVYFTRVFNPVWTYPDGFTWIEALRDESKIGLHVALTPTWNETAFFADFVLPMGHGPERHDLNTYETHGATWIAFRQPVMKANALAGSVGVSPAMGRVGSAHQAGVAHECSVTGNAAMVGQAHPTVAMASATFGDSRDFNPGQVWEEDEFWLALTWAIDPDGSMGIRKYAESQKSPGTLLTTDEYYAYAFERVPGLPEAAGKERLTPLEYMRKFGAFEVKRCDAGRHERVLTEKELEGATTDPASGVVRNKSGAAIGVDLPAGNTMVVDVAAGLRPGRCAEDVSNSGNRSGAGDFSGTHETVGNAHPTVEGFATPSRKLEFFSQTMVEWGWPEYAIPWYIPSHVYESDAATPARRGSAPRRSDEGVGSAGVSPAAANNRADAGGTPTLPESKIQNPKSKIVAVGGHDAKSTFVLLPTFRLPTLIHTRSGSAKWLNEISQNNPIWIHTSDAKTLGLKTGDLVRVITRIGYFVDKCWVTEGIRPGVVACSHHLGRWRREQDPPNSRWSGSTVRIDELGPDGTPRAGGGVWRIRQLSGPGPFASNDPDSQRIWWRDGGVHQNITFPVQPDPISGMHCWHQRVTVEKAPASDQSGDVYVDTNKSMLVYREWLAKTRWPVGPAPRADGKRLRRPLWLNRPLRPTDEAFWSE